MQYGNVSAILGLGSVPLSDTDTWSFVNTAFQNGYIASNTYTFQGKSVEDAKYAHITIGGYNYQDLSSNIEWFDMSNSDGWVVNISNMTLDD